MPYLINTARRSFSSARQFRTDLLRCCLVLVLVFCATARTIANDLSIPGRWGYNIDETFSGLGVLFHNNGQTPVVVSASTVGGALTSAPTSALLWNPVMSATAVNQFQSLSTANTITIQPGQNRLMHWPWKIKAPVSPGDLGVRTLTFAITYKVGTGSPVTVSTPATQCLLVGQQTQPSAFAITAIQALRPPAGVVDFSGNTLNASQYVNFMTINVGAVPASGRIRVENLQGNFRARLEVEDLSTHVITVLTSSSQTPTPPDNHTQPAPDMLWETLFPSDYVGKQVRLMLNDAIWYKSIIVGDVNGNFDLLIHADGEFTRLVTDEEGNEVPLPGGELVDQPDEDTSHVRPDPGPISGPDPKDNTAASTTVQDNYRATRAAIEDALGPNQSSQNFNFNDWRGDDRADGHVGAKSAGANLGASVEAVFSGGLPGGITLPSGNPVMAISTNYGNLVINPHTWAPTIRGFCLLFLSYTFWRGMLSIFRGGLTNNN